MMLLFSKSLLALPLILSLAAGHSHAGHSHHHPEHDRSLQDERPFWVGDYEYKNIAEFHSSGGRCQTADATESEQQETRGIVEAWIAKKNNGLSRQADIFPITIPVHFHIIRQEGSGDGSLDPHQSIEVIDAAFGEHGFQFSLASTDYNQNNAWYNADIYSTAESEMKTELHKGGLGDLNVYVASGGSYLGWATLPDGILSKQDGVLIAEGTEPGGNINYFDEGDTLTHEVGHWLGLYHTFHGACSGGDLVDDTPAESSPAYYCTVGRDSCPNDPGDDPIHNFMDLGEDACIDEFTPGQADRMQAQWCAYRTDEGACEEAPPNTPFPSAYPTAYPTGRPFPSVSPTEDLPSASPTEALPSASQVPVTCVDDPAVKTLTCNAGKCVVHVVLQASLN